MSKFALIKIHKGLEDAPKDRGIMMRAVTESNHDPEWTSGYWSEYDKAWVYDADSCAIEIDPDAWFDFPNTLTDVITPLVDAVEVLLTTNGINASVKAEQKVQIALAALKEQMK